MRISINPIFINTENDTISCSEAEISIAISNSVAISAVPVDINGTEYPDFALPVVGDAEQTDIANFMSSVAVAAQELLAGRA